ncbi:rhomboid family intramembrane serine protease [Albidovulum sp.]|uniref:rhomboid family intramembrane serine protease n=1 Tax=Albidovulum sp. TaxID=1872424 RepID=UPI001DD3C1C8|nr:rhomboid family intramembrane serine protease [Paracoccaceae bacterium]MCC0047170.1 rhomboid family intramembrane serine protease [Defluviimonas sp.]HPE25241.1 rhomboid family intramembrane serine protease [Albidovulum sp.]MCB2138745.1 rhomboid family intramembrane serine protease [Paracoccaceae bacterium]MCB2158841.1 rhomboid family intramembrane serine protease [Paracoccaceae bacterium]
MFPIRDHNPSGSTPWVTWALILSNALVFLIELGVAGNPGAEAQFLRDWALFPAAVTQGGEFGGILSSMFLHAGFMHLAGNMLFLWIFGDNLEDALGHAGFLFVYLASGVAAALAQIAADPMSMIPTVGASGAIGGVMGGYVLLYPRARVDVLLIFIVFFRVIAVPAWLMLGLWFAMQVFAGLGTPSDGGGVAYWAHVGGFAAGLVMTLPAWLRRGAAGYWVQTRGHPPHPASEYTPTRIPRVKRHKW